MLLVTLYIDSHVISYSVLSCSTTYLIRKGKTILCKNITHNLGSHGHNHNHNSQNILCNPGQSDQYRISNNKVFYEIKVITAMMVLLLDLHLPMQSVPILAKVVW
jgi:hypothetical protein